MPQSGRFDNIGDQAGIKNNNDISLSSNDATYLVNIPKNIGPWNKNLSQNVTPDET